MPLLLVPRANSVPEDIIPAVLTRVERLMAPSMIALLILLWMGGPASAEILGPQAAACADSAPGAAVLVHVTGFKDRTGNVRVELYPATDADFLTPGSKLRADGKVFTRIDVPTPPMDEPTVCLALPGPGDYAVAVLHDRNADGKLNAFSDGYGFPNNPRLGYSKPSAKEATFHAAAGQTQVDVVLNYWNGIAARPLRPPR